METGVDAFNLKNVVVIENGINLKRFNPNNQYKDIRAELHISEDVFLVGFIARITLQKAPLDYVKSIAIARQKNQKVKGLMIGEGDMLEETKEMIKQLGLENDIITSPFRSDIPDILHAVDVFCLPSLWEGLSIALLEAMAMAKPLVVTPTDGTRDVITDRENGLIVPFSDTEAAAAAYLEYFDNPTLTIVR